MKLIKSVTKYNIDFNSGEWVRSCFTDYEYKNNYPVSIKQTFYYEDETVENKTELEYVFDNNKPVSMKGKRNNELEMSVEYNDGKRYKIETFNKDRTSHNVDMYQYANDDEYFTLVFHSLHSTFPELPDEPAESMEEADEVTIYKSDKGLLTKTVNRGIYSNWIGDEDRIWYRFNGTYTAEYDEEGILKKCSAVYRAGPSGSGVTFETRRKDGLVYEVVMIDVNDNGLEEKYVFEYTDIETDASRYSRMINCHLLGEGNTYYIYNWY